MLGPDRLHVIDEAVAMPAVSTLFAPDGGGIVALVEGAVAGSVCFAERRGIGSALLLRAARAMAGAATLELSTTTPASEAFYSRLGFAAVDGCDFELFPGVMRPATCPSADGAALRAAAAPPS